MLRLVDAPIIVIREPGRSELCVVVREATVIGRDCDGILLTDPQMSRRHLQLQPMGPVLVVTDLASRNGTLIDGERLVGPVRLLAGKVLRVGATTVERIGEAPGSPAAASETGTLDRGVRETSIDVVAASVVDERPAIKMGDSGTVTIVFCDIEDSTRRALELGDARWIELLEVHNSIVRRHTARCGGTEVKAQGDGFMLSFPSARAAIDATVSVQRALATLARSRPADAVRVRVGVHTGEAIRNEGGDLFGRHVILAARVAGAADGGEILVSSLVRELVESRGDLTFGEPREVGLKGFSTPQTVHPVIWS